MHEHEHKAALIYSHLTALGWADSLPKDSILAGAAQWLTRRFSAYKQRRLPLEFSLMTDLKLLPLAEHSEGQCAIVVHASEVQCIELQEPILRLEKKHPKAGRYVWQALHRGLGLLGDYCSPHTLLYLLAMYYWQGEENEQCALDELKAQGEDISQIEMVRRAEVERQFPSWVLGREDNVKPSGSPKRLPFRDAARRLMAFQRESFPDHSLECQSIPIVYIPWDGSVMNQVADEHFNLLNQEYETVQALFLFDPGSLESFQKALKQFQLYLDVLQAVEDLLDGLLGAAEPRPVLIGTPKESPNELAATHALLLYNGANTMNRAIVTIHTVARGPGRYVLLPGKPANAPALHQLLTRFNPSIACQGLLPANLLRYAPGELLWHCPSRIEPIYFQTSHRELNGISGQRVRHPHLLFHVVRRNLYVAALPDAQRPTLQTNLLRAPYYNVNAGGQVCQGSMNGPRENGPEAIAKWERAFFHSAFTHPQGGAFQITSHPNCHSGLWLEQARQSCAEFPVQHLVPMKMNLNQWLTEHSQPKW